jgi:hypothetical protein
MPLTKPRERSSLHKARKPEHKSKALLGGLFLFQVKAWLVRLKVKIKEKRKR